MNSPLALLARRFTRASKLNWGWDLPRWQAHRGYHLDGIPENGIESLIEAAKRGARMCEFDVRLTKDQIPILFHDPDLSRMTGKEGFVHEIALKELRGFAKVTTLEEVLLDPRVPEFFNIEIKSEEIWNDPLERRVSEVIDRVGGQDRVIFSSFNPFSLWKLQTMQARVPRALLVGRDLKQRGLREMWFAPLLSLQALHFEDVLLPNAEAIGFWQERGFRVAVWTVNDVARIHRYWEWNIDSVITDLVPDETPF